MYRNAVTVSDASDLNRGATAGDGGEQDANLVVYKTEALVVVVG